MKRRLVGLFVAALIMGGTLFATAPSASASCHTVGVNWIGTTQCA